MKIFIGIDPGKSGAIAVIRDNTVTTLIPYDAIMYSKVLHAVSTLVHGSDCLIKVCVEKVSAMPGQGVVSMFNFGHNLGMIEGMLTALSLPYQLVPPQTWKKEFSLNSDKAKSIEVCQKLFPGVDLKATSRSRKPSDGLAEALLMAEYARRRL